MGLKDEYEEFGEGDEEDEERNFEDEDPNLTNEIVPLEDDKGISNVKCVQPALPLDFIPGVDDDDGDGIWHWCCCDCINAPNGPWNRK